MLRTSLLAFAITCASAASAHAITTISVGDHLLVPNTPGQIISILISDDAQGPNHPSIALGRINGIDLVLLMGGGSAGPIITNIDLVGPGTVFNNDNIGQFIFPQPFGIPGREIMALTSVTDPSYYTGVAANGILAFVTLDTSGIFLGSYPLSLSSVDLGPTDTAYLDFLPTLFDGTVRIVPEPASIVMGLMGAAALGAVVIRKRRAGR
jgi:hypothetical protein